MLTNIAAARITPGTFVAAGSAGLGVGARSGVPSQLKLVVEEVWQHPTEGHVIQPSADQSTTSDPRLESCAYRRPTVGRLASVGPVLAALQPRTPRLRRQRDRLGSRRRIGREAFARQCHWVPLSARQSRGRSVGRRPQASERRDYRVARYPEPVGWGRRRILTSPRPDVAATWSYSLDRKAIASIDTSRPRGRRTWAGAERAGGGSGIWRA